ncbi:MAG: hypothetical protein J3R72DRAFT_434059 [Linnemannia gamsii]|nr:MAG: hypothetical protein J3R72DRAFT_434059 [Linnemannia gamsii]
MDIAHHLAFSLYCSKCAIASAMASIACCPATSFSFKLNTFCTCHLFVVALLCFVCSFSFLPLSK